MPIPQGNLPDKQKKAKDRVLETLSQWIAEGVLEPGERLYDEELSTYFSVSRTPVREALQVLEEKGFVEILPGRYTRVTQMDPEDLKKLYPLLSHLHGIALTMAFPRIGAAEIERLESYNQELDRQLSRGNLEGARSADQRFHALVMELADNHYLSDFIRQLSLHAYRAETLYFKGQDVHTKSVEEHMKIIEALKRRDVKEAVRVTEENWMVAYRNIVERM